MHAEQKTRRHLFCRKAENFLGKQKNRKIMLNWTGKRHFHVKTWILKQSRPSYYWKPLPEPENQTSKSLFRLFWKKNKKINFDFELLIQCIDKRWHANIFGIIQVLTFSRQLSTYSDKRDFVNFPGEKQNFTIPWMCPSDLQ